jgi:hypothetical protein
MTWGCLGGANSLKGLVCCCVLKIKEKTWELCECKTQKEGMADKRTAKEGAMR